MFLRTCARAFTQRPGMLRGMATEASQQQGGNGSGFGNFVKFVVAPAGIAGGGSYRYYCVVVLWSMRVG